MSEIRQCNIKDIFSSDSYVIPIYQRNYAWGESEITQLIQDIVDYVLNNNDSNYYIGTLIVYERKKDGEISFETIDGQQRLTTLSILLSLINNEYKEKNDVDLPWYKKMNLKFDCRKNSTRTLEYLFSNKDFDNKDCNNAIKQGYEDAKKALSRILADKNVNIKDFCNYFFEKVIILRVLVPEDTDLNHYFEIMNTRGEQLEKHEILKAKCLEILDEHDRYAFNLIWEACSNMEKYVQYGFTTAQRDAIFCNSGGEKWNKLIDKENIYAVLKPKPNTETDNNNKGEISIEGLLKQGAKPYTNQHEADDENSDRFNTIVNFSNFLLHILRIQTQENIPLDDKRLIELFKPFLKDENNKKTFVRTFGYNLLKGKSLFDRYIIKREFTKGTDHWSLKRIKWNEEYKTISYVNTFGSEEDNDDINREILMLLSMFHVSAPTQVYKHWLNGALKYLFEKEETVAEDYKDYLENLANDFFHKRFLSSNFADYFDLIYGDKTVAKDAIDNIEHTEEEIKRLDSGTAVENFIFNYLDYLLWKDYRKEKEYFKFKNDNQFVDNKIRNFEYTFRSSVEHYYPRKPLKNYPILASDYLNSFGNLCLISGSKNSKLSDLPPNAKKAHYSKASSIDSIKQRIMMEYDDWTETEIEKHGNKMKELLLK